jgi:hypothetical protein
MKNKSSEKAPFTQPLLKELADRAKQDSAKQNPSVGSTPLQQPDLYQDPGSGYNTDFTFPQD